MRMLKKKLFLLLFGLRITSKCVPYNCIYVVVIGIIIIIISKSNPRDSQFLSFPLLLLDFS